jgi:hypothetical protein
MPVGASAAVRIRICVHLRHLRLSAALFGIGGAARTNALGGSAPLREVRSPHSG